MKQLFLIIILACSGALIAQCKEDGQPHTIAITNKIKPADLKKYGQMPLFSIKIGSLLLAPGDTIKVPVTNKLTVRYEYSFLKGVYKGANDIIFSLLDPSKKEYELNFSWKKEHEPWRIMIAGATAQEKKKA